MVDDEKNRDRLISVFERLENIVSEFATVEKLTSGFYVTDLKPYKLKDILDEAIDLTFANKDNIKFDIENLELIADFRLFSIAIKNLIDNGIKYSTDKQINIICNKEKIIFENRGSKLQHDLKYYLEPYTKEGTKSEGFGLGLYIVDFILKIHNYKLSYTHEDDKSKFIIDIINF
ncbi:MAG: HAMP domain-containing histidine kinase [Campylobacterales bacterium]|nr:HAMP domain-containing histidine kinase [Campylobacterales bacterium]